MSPVNVQTDLGPERLAILLDVRHPHAYLALGPAIQETRALGLEVDWLPLRTQPLHAPSEPGADDDRGILHRRARANHIARGIQAYAEAQGLVIRDPYRAAEVAPAWWGWLFVRATAPERLPEFLQDLFQAYWSLEADLSDTKVVAAVVERAGGEAATFLEWSAAEGPAADARLAENLQARGLSGTPLFLVRGQGEGEEDELFQGAQHWPMIRWVLDGRSGPIPI